QDRHAGPRFRHRARSPGRRRRRRRAGRQSAGFDRRGHRSEGRPEAAGKAGRGECGQGAGGQMKSIQRSCMRDEIRDAIAARILDATYAPGTRLKELALAKEFNVSQAPVREALRELAMLHLVETEHYRGTRVRSLDLPELAEAYELRFL